MENCAGAIEEAAKETVMRRIKRLADLEDSYTMLTIYILAIGTKTNI